MPLAFRLVSLTAAAALSLFPGATAAQPVPAAAPPAAACSRAWVGHEVEVERFLAFTSRSSLDGIAPIATVDRALWERMDALTPESVAGSLAQWLTADEQRALIARRDRMRQVIAKLVKEKGEARVFLE